MLLKVTWSKARLLRTPTITRLRKVIGQRKHPMRSLIATNTSTHQAPYTTQTTTVEHPCIKAVQLRSSIAHRSSNHLQLSTTNMLRDLVAVTNTSFQWSIWVPNSQQAISMFWRPSNRSRGRVPTQGNNHPHISRLNVHQIGRKMLWCRVKCLSMMLSITHLSNLTSKTQRANSSTCIRTKVMKPMCPLRMATCLRRRLLWADWALKDQASSLWTI